MLQSVEKLQHPVVS